GDGKLDIAAAINPEGIGPGGVSLLINNGDGTFQAARNFALGQAPTSISAGDFNRDGKLDLALATPDGSDVTVLLGNGDGTFQSAQPYSSGPAAYAMAVADFNADGFPDLVEANNNSDSGVTSTVSVLLNSANWTAPQASSLSVSGFPTPSTAGAAGNFTVTV